MRRSYFAGVAGRLTLMCVVVFVLVTALILSVALRALHADRLATAENQTRLIAEQYAEELTHDLNRTRMLVEGYRTTVATLINAHVLSREQAVAILTNSLREHPEILGHAFTFAPNAFDGADREHINAPWHDATGRFIPYVVHKGATIAVEALTDYDTPGVGDWFVVPQRTQTTLLQEPYFYNIDGSDVLMTTISDPILDRQGRFLGVVTADIRLSWLQQRIAHIHALNKPSSYAFLISASGAYVAHSLHPERVMTSATAAHRNLTEIRSLARGESRAFYRTDADRPGENLCIYLPIRLHGIPDATWILGIMVSRADILADFHHSMWWLIAASVIYIGLIMIGLPWLVHRLLAKPVHLLNQVVESAPESAQLSDHRNDELFRATSAAKLLLTRLGAILDTMSDGLITVSGQGLIERCNPAAAALLGRDKQIAGQLGSRTSVAAAFKSIPAVESISQAVGEVLEQQTTRNLVVTGVGERLAIHVRPIPDRSGAVITLRSLRDEDRARAEIEHQRAELQAILDHSPTIIFGKNAGGAYIFVNRKFCDVFARPAEAVIGRTDRDLWLPYQAEAFVAADAQVLLSGAPVELEETIALTGGTRSYLTIKFPLCDSTGTITGICAISTDITERKQAEIIVRRSRDELEALVDARTRDLGAAQQRLALAAHQAGMAEIAANVLHNVGNVLTSVVVSGECLRERAAFSRISVLDQIAERLATEADPLHWIAHTAPGQQLPELIRQLAAVLRLERAANNEDLERIAGAIEHIRHIVAVQQSYASGQRLLEALALDQLIRNGIELCSGAITRQRAAVHAELVPTTWHGERHRLLQIIVNLIANAVDAVADVERPDVRVTLIDAGDGPVITVSDNGIGITPEHMAKLFTSGFTTKSDGHGFGLHSCIMNAQSMGAVLTAHSAGSAKGSRFILRLPISTSPSTSL